MLSQMLISLREAAVCFHSSGSGRSASYLNNMESVLCHNIIVPVAHTEGSDKKRKPFTISSCHCQFCPVVVRRSLGHGSIRRISPQMGLGLYEKRKRRGMDAQASKRAEIFKCRQTHSSKEITLSSLVRKGEESLLRGMETVWRDVNTTVK